MKLNINNIQFKKLDYIIIAAVIVFAVLCAWIFVGKSKIAKTPVIAENTVVFQVFFRGVTLTTPQSPMLPMDDSFITIRNVPHKKVTILDSRQMPRFTVTTDAKGRSTIVEDVSTPFLFDCLVTLYDDAKITDDGAVLGGNKLKIGLPIVLEGKNYRFAGTVSDIRILDEKEAQELKAQVAKAKEAKENPQPISPLDVMNMTEQK